MMKEHRSSKGRAIGGAASLALMVAGGLTLGTPGFAQDAAAKDARDVKEERHVRIMVREHADGAKAGQKHVTRFRGAPGDRARLIECEGGEKFETEVTGTDGNKDKMKFFVCARGGASANLVPELERGLERIGKDEEISAQNRAKITAALRAEIDRRKAAN